MDRLDKKPSRSLPLVFAFFLVYGLLSLLNLTDPFSYLLRPAIVWLVGLSGLAVQNHADFLIIGKLTVPWTRDCAGINLLLLLWALLIWFNRERLTSPGFWLKFLLAIPVSLVANLARILTLVAYRWVFHPATESASLHYLIGFLWILPFLQLLVVVEKADSASRIGFLEIAYVMGLLALAASHIGSPSGHLVLLATLVLIVELRTRGQSRVEHRWTGALWLGAGLMIAIAGMESLWIGFLLLCPYCFPAARWKQATTYGTLLATIPLLAMQPYVQWVLLGVVALKAYGMVARPAIEQPAAATGRWSPLSVTILLAGLLMPFLMPIIPWRSQTDWSPSAGQLLVRMDATSFQLKVIAQSPDLQFFCYLPTGGGRHHTLPVCMRYRGVQLEAVAGQVMTDGTFWMKQYFYHEGELLRGYPHYVWRTAIPFSEAGIHVIATAAQSSMDAQTFEQSADAAMARVFN
jgi:exosortase/archaeosortase family protein